MVLKRQKLIALWWLANGANWFREQEMEKWRQNCTASHLRGTYGGASKTASLTVWWRKIPGGWFRRGVIQAETQAHISELQGWAAWLTGCSEANTRKKDASGRSDSKEREKRQKDLGRDHRESFIKVLFGKKNNVHRVSGEKKNTQQTKNFAVLNCAHSQQWGLFRWHRCLKSHTDLCRFQPGKKVLITSWPTAFSDVKVRVWLAGTQLRH